VQVGGLPQECSLGQPSWAPDGSGLLFVGWAHDPANFKGAGKKLGVVYCFNRPCGIYYLPLAPEGCVARACTEQQGVVCSVDNVAAIASKGPGNGGEGCSQRGHTSALGPCSLQSGHSGRSMRSPHSVVHRTLLIVQCQCPLHPMHVLF
jgi:hypothetical protein